MGNRREGLLDAAIGVVGESGIHALTHRAVDTAAGLPPGSTSNHFRTRDALPDAVVERFAARERANWEDIAARLCPTTPQELARALSMFAQDVRPRPAGSRGDGPAVTQPGGHDPGPGMGGHRLV